VADYHDAKGICAQRIYEYDNVENVWWHSGSEVARSKLFGQHLWQAGGKRLVIAHDEFNAIVLAQAQGLKWPVVGVPGAKNAAEAVRKELEFVNSFGEVVLAFDGTEAGKQAVEDVASLLTPGKAKIMQFGGHADAQEALKENAGDKLTGWIWQASTYRPDGIVFGCELWDDIIAPPPVGFDIPYPLLNSRMKGIRTGQIYLMTAGSGIGKSTLAHEIGFHLLTEHNQKVGCFGLEEPRKRLAERYIAMGINKQIHVDRTDVSQEEIKRGFDETINNKDWCLYDHRGSKDINSILAKVRYMVVGLGMQWIVFDHISIVVSGLDEGTVGESERKTIDKLMTGFSSMVEELNFGLLAIVHLKRKDKGRTFNEGRKVSLTDLRGSGGLEQMSHVVISMERNQQDEEKKNYSQLRLLKHRDLGDTGLADVLQYYPETGRLLASTHNPFKDTGGTFHHAEESDF